MNEIGKVVINNVPGIFSYLKGKYEDINFKTEEDLEIVYQQYLEYSEEKYTKIKTILYKSMPKPLYEFYECLNVENKGRVVSSENVQNIMNEGKKIIITGTGGIGKSMLMKHFFLDTINKGIKIPIFIELRNLNNEQSLDIFSYLYKSVKSLHLDLKSEYFEATLRKGRYLILFDGFDEIKGDISNKISKEIIDFSDKYSENHIIISSRPSDIYVGWENFKEYQAMGLDKKQAMSLINKIDYDKEIKAEFHSQLEKKLYDEYKSFANIPLLLTIMLLTFENGMEIPGKINEFYEQAYNSLFQRHDSLKSGYKRDIKTKLSSEEFKEYLAYISFKSFFNSQIELTHSELVQYIEEAKSKFMLNKNFNCDDFIVDLVESVCMFVQEGLNYKYSHRSFQEYFAAVYTSKLDDNIQSKLLISWIKEKPEVLNFSKIFFDSLKNIQMERYINNVILHFFNDLDNQLYNIQEDFSSFVKKFFNGVSLRYPRDDTPVILLSIDAIYKPIFRFTLELIEMDGKKINEIDSREREHVTTKLKCELIENRRYSMEELETEKLFPLFVEYCSTWLIPRIEFSNEWIKEFKKSKKISKRKFDNILAEL